MDLELIFQLVNTVLLIAILYVFYYVIFKVPQKFKNIDDKIYKIEDILAEMNEKSE
ncbi:hypothetical protein SAMN02745945_01286 [Peptoclostridium litorale DSM 5388]|uniref:Uncharacterized protein n=1 Tax=Peptoclostridium litorale DSM 5388 TaxID=1121324 RepID=A0A069RDK1_PEPLI|nr:hypothetical protein [Peptoclostridium litorale]KDR94843.1 hypothetical protein CLIT_13c01650 [Peptoclostridium litorale DSM 5388]SIN93910.1 hypothetical protein SAMN02745945_01286 [Peptoclostridium litorale DSM 5388]